MKNVKRALTLQLAKQKERRFTREVATVGRKTGDKVAIRHGRCAEETCTNSGKGHNGRERRWSKGPLEKLRHLVATATVAG